MVFFGSVCVFRVLGYLEKDFFNLDIFFSGFVKSFFRGGWSFLGWLWLMLVEVRRV